MDVMVINQPIVLFDGVCNLCNSSVQFIIKHDEENKFLFSSLQSEKGQELLRNFHLPVNDFDTFVLVEKDKYYTKSTAALRVLKHLGKKWRMAYACIIIPKPIRDFVYSIIARNRYKIWGKQESCWLPTPELQKRFL